MSVESYLNFNGLKVLVNNIKSHVDERITNIVNNMKSYVDERIANIIDSAPETLNTLNELSQALGSDENFATTVATEIGTKAEKEDLDKLTTTVNQILNMIYPIGSVYISTVSTSPDSIFGGTWEQIKDCFLLSAGDIYDAGKTGGESEHILTIDEMPNHTHRLKTDIDSPDYNVTWSEWFEYVEGWTQQAGETESPATQTTSTGGSQPHNNMPPYLTVYMWKRIS